jgi:hypothetical protein
MREGVACVVWASSVPAHLAFREPIDAPPITSRCGLRSV